MTLTTTKTYPTNDTMDRSFLEASIQEIIKQLTAEEKISLLSGKDFWATVPIARLNIPSVKTTDGPNGARGGSFYHMTPAVALPNATCLASTFSLPLMRTAAHLLAAEAKARHAVCLLAPTINTCRSPLGGRAFESFSEDSTLAGLMAAEYVAGIQEKGVSATIKHFVTNDQEHERMGNDAVVSERALREVYLRPFQIAQAKAQPWAYMTSYNRLNGTHSSENKWLLTDLLKKEWGHDGLIMSDWYGTYSVSESINAGLSLEMPGPARWRDAGLVGHVINAHKIKPKQIDALAGDVLRWVQKLAKANPDLVYAPPKDEETRTEAQEEDAKFVRKLYGEGIVLLKNEGDVLPLGGAGKKQQKQKVAVIGPNAKDKVITGGGSALLRAAWSQSPWEGLVANAPSNVELQYSLGCFGAKFLPTLGAEFTATDGSPGFDLLHYKITPEGKQAAEPKVVEKWDSSDLMMADFYDPELGFDYFSEIKAVMTPETGGEWEFGMTITGSGFVEVDGKKVAEYDGLGPRGTKFFGNGSDEIRGTITLEKGRKYQVRFLHDTRKSGDHVGENTPFNLIGFRYGAFPKVDPDQAIADAVALAKSCDTAVIVTGLNADWESEGYDRPDLSLPLLSNRLITEVAKANPNTVVVVQAGSATSMPWVDQVKGVVQAWYGGNETGNAIADILYGTINPSGRLSLSFPKEEKDIAAALNYKSARTQTHYEEGVYVGYKHHNARGIPALFPFGHGLSYTSFDYSDLKIVEGPTKGKGPAGWTMKVQVKVTNSGKTAGSHSVHFYTCPPAETDTSLRHPQWALQAFTKVDDLAPGKSAVAEVTLEKYAISHWDDLDDTWRAEQGEWSVKVGIDAATMWGDAKFVIDEDLEWRGV